MREFLKTAGCNPDNYTREDRKKKESLLLEISKKLQIKSESVGQVTGNDRILRSKAVKVQANFSRLEDNGGWCNKDTEVLYNNQLKIELYESYNLEVVFMNLSI